VDSERERELFERLAALEARVADMEEANRILGLKASLGAGPDGGTGGVNGTSEGGGSVVAEWGGLRFMVSPGEDPEAKGKAMRRAMDRADGKLPYGDAG
jgi:hypothetical protein